MKYLRYLLETHLLESYQLATKEWSASHDKNDVDQTIKLYKDLINKNKISGAERDINHWRKTGFDQFKQFVTQTKTQVETADTKGNRKKAIKAASNEILTIKKTDDMHLFMPLSKEASCFYAGNKTPWCISTRDGDNYFYQYTVRGGNYIFFLIHDDQIYALVLDKDMQEVLECQDKTNNNTFPPERFLSIAGLNMNTLRDFVAKNEKDIKNNLGTSNDRDEKRIFGKKAEAIRNFIKNQNQNNSEQFYEAIRGLLSFERNTLFGKYINEDELRRLFNLDVKDYDYTMFIKEMATTKFSKYMPEGIISDISYTHIIDQFKYYKPMHVIDMINNIFRHEKRYITGITKQSQIKTLISMIVKRIFDSEKYDTILHFVNAASEVGLYDKWGMEDNHDIKRAIDTYEKEK